MTTNETANTAKKTVKVYTKLSKYIEEISRYSNSRKELKVLLEQLQKIPDQGYRTVRTETPSAVLDDNGHPIKLIVQKQKREFTSEENK